MSHIRSCFMSANRRRVRLCVTILAVMSCLAHAAHSDDWPMLGRDGTRNSVSAEAGAPQTWCIEERDSKANRLIRPARGVRWSAPLGLTTFSTPVVSSGLVWIGTNGGDWADSENRLGGVLNCFRVSDGKL